MPSKRREMKIVRKTLAMILKKKKKLFLNASSLAQIYEGCLNIYFDPTFRTSKHPAI